jgi:hypothetical protein
MTANEKLPGWPILEAGPGTAPARLTVPTDTHPPRTLTSGHEPRGSLPSRSHTPLFLVDPSCRVAFDSRRLAGGGCDLCGRQPGSTVISLGAANAVPAGRIEGEG